MAKKSELINEAKGRYNDLKELLGKNVAIFTLCAFCDIPFMQEIQADSWEQYARTVGMAKSFRDGATDFHLAEESEMTREARWETVWGVGYESNKYTENDYIQLDKLFQSYSSRLVSAGGYDKLQEDTLRYCSRLALERDKCVSKGGKENVDMAAKLDKMIQDNLGSENLRKKDAKPVDDVRIDSFIDALQKKTGCGKDATYEQVMDAICRWMLSHRYPITRDAVEHAILCIINATRRNNDEPEMSELPPNMRLPENSPEFEQFPSREEKDVYKYLNLERDS